MDFLGLVWLLPSGVGEFDVFGDDVGLVAINVDNIGRGSVKNVKFFFGTCSCSQNLNCLGLIFDVLFWNHFQNFERFV